MITKNPASAREVDKFKGHARFLIEHHFGSRPRRIKFMSAGLSNFVFAVTHPEGDFIVRISPDPAAINSFIKEHWAQRAAKDAGIPTAEILEVGSAIIPFPYMITKTVAGTNALSHPEKNKIVREMGRIAATVNTIRTKGFGATFDWSNNQLSRNDTWTEYFRNEYRYEEKLETLKRSKLVQPATARALKSILLAASKTKPRAVLCHSDLRLKNVLADESGTITAVIDWENSISSIPQWELSLALHDLGIDEMQHFIEGYGIKPKKFAETAPLIKAFNILNYATEVERAIAEKDKAGLERVRVRMSGVFDLYSI